MPLPGGTIGTHSGGTIVRQQSTTDEQNPDLFSAPPQDTLSVHGSRRSPSVSRAAHAQPSLVDRIGVALRATHELAFPRPPILGMLAVKSVAAEPPAQAA